MSTALKIELRSLMREHVPAFCHLVIALAEFEKLAPPDAAAQARLVEDALGEKPRIEVWLAFVNEDLKPCGYMILVETYSSFLALPTLYLEDLFVMPDRRKGGVGGALLKKVVSLAQGRGCGRVEWTALDWNVNAQQVYEQRLGATRMSEWLLYRMTRQDMQRLLDNETPQKDIVGTSISE
jgi:GNAT superfamily N-acetyltransferase